MKIKYSFNLFEILIIYLFHCKLYHNITIKRELYKSINNKLNEKLDIVLYIKNIFIIELILNIFLDSNKKNIINFLDKPIISIKENNQIKAQENNCYEKLFDKFYEGNIDLIEKSEKNEIDKNIILLSKQRLLEFE